MRYVAAYLLAVLGGKAAPSSADIEKILSSVGIEADSEKLKKVLSELANKSVEELIVQGEYLILTIPIRDRIIDILYLHVKCSNFARFLF